MSNEKKKSRKTTVPVPTKAPAWSMEGLLGEMKREREDMMVQGRELLESSGKGLFKGQLELKNAPWQLTWSRLDMMLKRQEQMICLLWEMNKNIREQSGSHHDNTKNNPPQR